MGVQNNSISAFIESMKRSGFFSSWTSTLELVCPGCKSYALSNDDIERCNQNAWKVSFQSGSYVHTDNKTIYVFTVLVNMDREERDPEYGNELKNLLKSLNKNECDLIDISAKDIGVSGIDNVYYWRLVFKHD